MSKRVVEVFTAGCSLCDEAVTLVDELACDDCDVLVLDMQSPEGQEKAKAYGVTRVPAVAVDGVLADCCAGGAIDAATLRGMGVGAPA